MKKNQKSLTILGTIILSLLLTVNFFDCAFADTIALYETFDNVELIEENGGILTGGYSFIPGATQHTNTSLYIPAAGSLKYPNDSKAVIQQGTIGFWVRPDELSGGLLGIGELTKRNSFGIFIATHPTWRSKHVVLEMRDDLNRYYQAWSHKIPVEAEEYFFTTVTWGCDSKIMACVNGDCGFDKAFDICSWFTFEDTIEVGHTGFYPDADAAYDDMKMFDYQMTREQVKEYYESYLVPCEGDFDTDSDVDGSDLALFAADFGRTDCDSGPECEGDFDHDNDVDGSDLAVFAADFGRTDCP